MMGHIPVADWGDGEPIPLPGNKQPNTGKPKLMEMTSEMKTHICGRFTVHVQRVSTRVAGREGIVLQHP